MKKKILIYCWSSVCEPMTIRALSELGYEVCIFDKKLKDYHADAMFAREFIGYIHEKKPDVVFSYDYFPMISMICQMNRIPYASWIYDCPQYTLLSKTIVNDMNYIFCFDEVYAERLQQTGVKNVYHFPLAADMALYENAQKENEENYVCDISFVGSLYNDSKNRIFHTKLDEYERGYIEGIICSQLRLYGYNLVKEALNEDIVEKIITKCNLTLGDSYLSNTWQMAADAIGMEVTSRERQNVLELLSTYFDVSLFTTSSLPESLKNKEKLVNRGTVDYALQMPLVFRNSKINLNITSRTIETGIPQRVFDILACDGFCLTNYQKEIADIFEDGRELVMYSSMEDLLVKAEYYLKHDKERREIAKAGYEKVCAYFGINTRIRELLQYI